jgi:hypothetical protein
MEATGTTAQPTSPLFMAYDEATRGGWQWTVYADDVQVKLRKSGGPVEALASNYHLVVQSCLASPATFYHPLFASG